METKITGEIIAGAIPSLWQACISFDRITDIVPEIF